MLMMHQPVVHQLGVVKHHCVPVHGCALTYVFTLAAEKPLRVSALYGIGFGSKVYAGVVLAWSNIINDVL